jgi:hypothetical protein
MNNSGTTFNRRLALLVLFSFLFVAASIALRIGIDVTPYETTDSAGRTMGFNDRFSAEHYAMALRNFQWGALLSPERAYEWLLLAANGLGAVILLRTGAGCTRLTRWYFALQALVFPWGLALIPLLPISVVAIFRGTADREDFTDFPCFSVPAYSMWVATALIVTIALRGRGLGFSILARGMREAIRAGSRRFLEVVR